MYIVEGDRYANVAWMAYGMKGDIYFGPTSVVNGQVDTELSRNSYHSSGVSISRVGGSEQRGLRRVSPQSIKGLEKLGGTSAPLDELQFGPRLPKQETSTRKNLAVDGQRVRGRIITLDMWVAEPGNEALIKSFLAHYASIGCEVIGDLRADWCIPNLGITLYTMSEKTMQSFLEATGGSAPMAFVGYGAIGDPRNRAK